MTYDKKPGKSRVNVMRGAALDVDVVPSSKLSGELRREIVTLCNAAYGEDVADLFDTFGQATHVIGRSTGQLVSHTMWVTRWLQPSHMAALKTAYVEMVATLPAFWRHGYATCLMQRLVQEIPSSYALAALCPAEPTFYQNLGWRMWQGPLFIRVAGGTLPTPDESIMVFDLPNRPRLDSTMTLSAEWREGELW